MVNRIPVLTSLGFLALTTTGCPSDAAKVSNAYKAICKARCECPDIDPFGLEEESNCKKACRGYAKVIEAQYLDLDDEPCDELDDIIADFKACAQKDCDEIYECLYGEEYDYYNGVYVRLNECWPRNGYEYEYDRLPEDTLDDLQTTLEAVPHRISGPLLRQALHAAACDQAEAAR